MFSLIKGKFELAFNHKNVLKMDECSGESGDEHHEHDQ